MSVHSVWKVDGYLLGTTTVSKYYSPTLPFRISRSISFDLFHLGGVTIQLDDTNILEGKGMKWMNVKGHVEIIITKVLLRSFEIEKTRRHTQTVH